MLPIILNNLFTRHRKDMAAAEKAREQTRRHQRLTPREPSADAPTNPEAQAEAQLQTDKPEKG